MPVTLTLPTVLVTAGSTYATQINAAIQAAADATHTGGANGDKWTAASINIDANLPFNGYSATSVKAITYTQQSSVATANSVWAKTDGTLHYTNGAGVDIQLTSGSGLNTAALITATWTQLVVSTNYTIGAANNYTHFLTAPAAPLGFTLPAANGVSAGRFYIISDTTGTASSNNITISRAGSDTFDGGGTSYTIDQNYGYAIVVSDGTSKWTVVNPRNATTSVHGMVKLAQDLGGTGTAPTVVSLTGSGGKVIVRDTGTNATHLEFATVAAGLSPEVRPEASSGDVEVTMYLLGQAAGGGGNRAGGDVIVAGGNNTGTGAGGSAYIASTFGGANDTGVSVKAFSATRRVTGLQGSPSTTDVPTGDKVVWIANCSTTPSSNPVGGGVLYVNAGALTYRGPGGTTTVLALS